MRSAGRQANLNSQDSMVLRELCDGWQPSSLGFVHVDASFYAHFCLMLRHKVRSRFEFVVGHANIPKTFSESKKGRHASNHKF